MSKEKTVPGISPRADWRDPESYKPLIDLDRAGWAWEWLKRNPDFATAAGGLPQVSPPLRPSATEPRLKAAQPRVLRIQNPGPFEHWGVFFHHWRCPAGYGRLLAARSQSIGARRGSAAHCTRPHRRLRHPMLCVNDDRVVLRRIRARAFQRWLAPSPTDGDGRQCSRWPGVPPLPAVGSPAHGGEGSDAATPVRALPPGRLPRGLFPPERRARRWAMMLRAWDGEMVGASRRQVAAAIFGEMAARELWESGYRSRMQRLVGEAEEMVSGDYLGLLRRETEGKRGF
ncbi:conserved hypothetical protein [uncultured Alphaproteobacteria bacterium]|uniref:DUF2285 domain-containing protein n=1 Tax=uncultured Alphaproteobacteria bacterium TaxID=91750 RepID=A0A212IZB9_9PROT|nr:conserved hypothetical protein [uncultured Alphaproteobacteria bacterium]